MKIDNYALTMFQSCPAKYQLRINEGWVPRRKSAALGFGGAFHHGIAAWYDTADKIKMLQVLNTHWPDGMPVDDYRTKQKCAEVLIGYTKEYPGETFQFVEGPKGKLIEVAFTIATGMYLPLCWRQEVQLDGTIETHGCGYDNGRDSRWDSRFSCCLGCGEQLEEIEYGGIFDGLVEFSGAVYVFEHKTTSQLGPSYFDQFRPNNQITGYTWAAGLLSNKRVGGALINAVGVYKASPTRFERQISLRSDEEINEWLSAVHDTCCRIQRANMSGHFPLQTISCTMYGRCEYHSVHSLPYPAQRRALLEQDYMISKWDYEARDD